MIAQEHLTPLFKVMGIKGMKLFNPEFSSKGLSDDVFSLPSVEEGSISFSEMAPEFD